MYEDHYEEEPCTIMSHKGKVKTSILLLLLLLKNLQSSQATLCLYELRI